MPTSELNDDNCPLPRLIEETPEEKAEREKREAKRKEFVDRLKSAATLAVCLAWLTGCTDSKASGPVHVQDETLCNAKYANWILRHEELSKPQPEQWHAFKRYMGECVR